jgi:outer membrane protein TolC
MKHHRQKIYNKAEEQLAMVKAVEFRKLSAAKGVQAARGNFYPQLSLGATSSLISRVRQDGMYF